MEEGRELVSVKPTERQEPVRVVEGQVIPPDERKAQEIISRARRREDAAWARQRSLGAVPAPQVHPESPLGRQMASEGRPPSPPPAEEKPRSFVDRLRGFFRE